MSGKEEDGKKADWLHRSLPIRMFDSLMSFRNDCRFFPFAEMGDAEMRAFWRQMKHELFAGRDATLILAIIASFIAWIVTDLLKTIFG